MSDTLREKMCNYGFSADSELCQRKEVFEAIIAYDASTGGRISNEIQRTGSPTAGDFLQRVCKDVLEHFILIQDIEDSIINKTSVFMCDNMRENVVQFSITKNLKTYTR